MGTFLFLVRFMLTFAVVIALLAFAITAESDCRVGASSMQRSSLRGQLLLREEIGTGGSCLNRTSHG